MTNYWWSLLTSHICSKFEPDLSLLTNWGSMNNGGGVTLPSYPWEKFLLEIDMRKWHPNEEKNVMKSKLIFLPFISGWWIHIQIHPSNTWTLLKLDGVQASRFSSHINRASLSDQNDGICTVIYLLPRLLQLEWEKKESQQNKKSSQGEAKF